MKQAACPVDRYHSSVINREGGYKYRGRYLMSSASGLGTGLRCMDTHQMQNSVSIDYSDSAVEFLSLRL